MHGRRGGFRTTEGGAVPARILKANRPKLERLAPELGIGDIESGLC